MTGLLWVGAGKKTKKQKKNKKQNRIKQTSKQTIVL